MLGRKRRKKGKSTDAVTRAATERAAAANAALEEAMRAELARAEAARVRSAVVEEVLAIGRSPSPPPKPASAPTAAAQATIERTPVVASMNMARADVGKRGGKAPINQATAQQIIDLLSEDEEEEEEGCGKAARATAAVRGAAATAQTTPMHHSVPEVVDLMSSEDEQEEEEKAEEPRAISSLLGAMSIQEKLPQRATPAPAATAAATDTAAGISTASAPARALTFPAPAPSPAATPLPSAAARAVPPPLSHWSTAFLPRELALGRWRDEPGRLLLVCLEAADQSSLHLVRQVYPHSAVRELLSHPNLLPVRVDGGREADRAEADFWLREVGGAVLPSLALLWGASGKLIVHERKLDPASFARQLTRILSELGGSGGGGQGCDGDGSCGQGGGGDGGGGGGDHSGVIRHIGSLAHARATALLVTYRREAARGFRPRTPQVEAPVHVTQQELDRRVRAEIDAAYEASLRADQEREVAREAAACEADLASAVDISDTLGGKETQAMEAVEEGGEGRDVNDETTEEDSPPPLTLEQIRDARMAFYARTGKDE